MGYDAAVTDWLKRHRLDPPDAEHPDWGIEFHLSTAPLSDWTVRRSRIPPDALWFGAKIHRLGGWRACLMTRDKALDVSWSGARPVEVGAGTFLHRHRTAWPMPNGPDGLPGLVSGVEQVLQRRFIRHAEVEAHSLKGGDLETLRRWLSSLCDTIDLWAGTIHGALPEGVEHEDERARGRGLQIRIRTDRPLSSGTGT